MSFDNICFDLDLGDTYLAEFRQAWEQVCEAQEQRCVKTLSSTEAYLAWLLILNLRPKAVLELGGQHGHSGIIFSHATRIIGSTFITVELGSDPSNPYPVESRGTLQFLPKMSHVETVWGDAKTSLDAIFAKHPVDFVFHDADHTWDGVETCVTKVLEHNPNAVQCCHDCRYGIWQPDVETPYGRICAERPVFDKYFGNNPNYYYRILEEKYGFGFAIPQRWLKDKRHDSTHSQLNSAGSGDSSGTTG